MPDPQRKRLYQAQYRRRHRARIRAQDERYRRARGIQPMPKTTPDQAARAHRNNRLIRQYGITLDRYEQMVRAQHGVCLICRQPCASGQHLSVDHNHVTGRLRGLLCHAHNKGLGFFDVDNRGVELLQAAIAYVLKYDGSRFPLADPA